MFKHIHHEFPKLLQENSETGRVYLTPTGERYPSVTTVLADYGKEGLMEWRKRVGEKQANRISRQATNRGTGVHEALETYLQNEDVSLKKMMPNVKNLYLRMREELRLKVDNIHCLETKLFSHKLGLAGTVDCVAEYKGILSAIDFKTSNKLKKKANIGSYFMQGVAYSKMFTEMTGIPINQVVILIGVDSANFCQTLVVKEPEMQLHLEGLKGYIEQYKNKNNTVQEILDF